MGGELELKWEIDNRAERVSTEHSDRIYTIMLQKYNANSLRLLYTIMRVDLCVCVLCCMCDWIHRGVGFLFLRSFACLLRLQSVTSRKNA